MTVANHLIEENKAKLSGFLDVISVCDATTYTSSYCPISALDEVMTRILSILFDYKNRLGQAAVKLVC